jgi:hypothetical protein
MKKHIYFFANGVTVITDEKGEQMTEGLTLNWVRVFGEYLKNQGLKPEEFKLHFQTRDGIREGRFFMKEKSGEIGYEMI